MTDIDVHPAAYALDALDDRSARIRHYGKRWSHRRRNSATLTQVADSLVAPPPMSLKDKVMAVAATRQLSPLVAPSSLSTSGGAHVP